MLRKIATFLFLCALSILCGLSTGKAQDTKPNRDDETSSVLAKDLAAFQALRSLLASRRYVLTDKQLVDMVGKYLRETGKAPPHKFPTVTDLQKPLDSDFGAFYDAMIGKSTSGLDPKGKLGLEKRLRDYLAQHKGLEATSRSRYRKYLDNDLPKILVAARDQITSQQVAQLTEALTEYMASGKPAVEEIESAFRDGNNATALMDRIKGEVLDEVDTELCRILLVDADEKLAQSVDYVVSDGIRQLKSQINVLEEKPRSHTLQGITKELLARLGSFVKEQSKPLKPGPLWKHYGTFPLANTAIGKEAEGHFGHRLAAAAGRVMALVKNGSQPLPSKREKDIRQTILAAMPLHHEFAESKRLLQPKIDGWVEEDQQQWTARDLLQAAEDTPSKHDEAYSLQGFRDDIEDISGSLQSGDMDVGKSWKALRDGLTRQYAEKLLPKVRAEIVQADALRCSPSLVDGTWRAIETEIDSFGSLASRLGREQLSALHVWASRPSAPKAVLDETWQLWTESAKRELAIGNTALHGRDGQEGVVIEVKPQMADRIRSDPRTDLAYWVNEYTSLVNKNWQGRSSNAAKHYPELFSHTRVQIEREVKELLEIVATERKEEEERAAKAREMIESPKTVDEGQEEIEKSPLGPGEEGKGLAPSETDESKQGGQSTTGDGKTGEGDVSPDDDGQEMDATSTDGTENDEQEPSEDTAEQSDEQKTVLSIQNEIVDRLKPDIAAEIGEALVTQRNLEVSYWIEVYDQRTTTMWNKEKLSGEYPELLPSVVERIEDLVAELLSIIQGSIRDRVLARQMTIVEEHRFGTRGNDSIMQIIDNDPNATQSEYETLFIDRVLRQWQSDMSEVALQLRREYPNLLSEVEDMIRGIVAFRITGKSGQTGDNPTDLYLKFYRIGFWSLLFMVIVMAGCWYWNVRYLREYIVARRLAD